jgi:hypothetical protein
MLCAGKDVERGRTEQREKLGCATVFKKALANHRGLWNWDGLSQLYLTGDRWLDLPVPMIPVTGGSCPGKEM